jgi:hypothetical protein
VVTLNEVYDKIIDQFGMSRWYDWFPSLILYADEGETWKGRWCYGEFCEVAEEISINVAAHYSTRHIIKTILHEYCHYLQRPGWYTRYAGIYSYDRHPYEIQADEFAEEHIGMFNSNKR